MSPSTPLATSPTTTNGSGNGGSSVGAGDSDMSSNRTLVITLSSVLGSVALLLIAGAILICWRYRRGRGIFFTRGISPIDDDEIATWKVPRDEKTGLPVDTDVEADGGAAAALNKEMGGPSHTKQASTSSIRKPPSVIVYPNAHGQGGYRHSTDEGSPRSFSQGYQSYYGGAGRMSLDKALPQTPIQARAPNAREGLTDESIPGDEPFIASPRRQPSRLSKLPPGMPYSQRRMHGHHSRTRSSRSSTRSFAGYGSGIGSDMDLAPGRHSHDQVHMRQYHHSHSRVYSTSSIPPRLSLGDESFGGPLASPRTMFRDHGIGRAIG